MGLEDYGFIAAGGDCSMPKLLHLLETNHP